MAYNNNQRGGYGNRQGGRSQNYGNRGGNRGGFGGGRNGGGNNRGSGGGDDFKYVRSSFFSKHLIFEAEKQGNEPAPREEKALEPGITEEITLTLSPQKTEMLMKKLQDAINDQAGDGGVRMTMYCQHKINQQDNSEFDGASILVVAKFPPKNQNGFGGQKGGSGRKDFPERGQGQQQEQQGSESQRYSENNGW
jgi:hypothetical protein